MRPLLASILGVIIWLGLGQELAGQGRFGSADSLRGQLDGLRAAYRVSCYDLQLEIDLEHRQIHGEMCMKVQWRKPVPQLRLDLDSLLTLDSVRYQGKRLPFVRKHSAVWVAMPKMGRGGDYAQFHFYYRGSPRQSLKPPWDGGVMWTDSSFYTAVEGEGASLWYPCKDHLSEKADTTILRIKVPMPLVAVANGQCIDTLEQDGFRTFTWVNSYPMPSYSAALYVGQYVHFQDQWQAKQGWSMPLDYYVFPQDLTKAKAHFSQVGPMLSAFETYLGPYPFRKAGYALVQAPYWGMEHQSAIAYGNGFKNNPEGFDFIIIHESAHEYWGNAVSCSDHAEMVIQEGFCTYMESLYLEATQGPAARDAYLQKQKKLITHAAPMLGPLGVNFTQFADNDIYYKGALMLHSLRLMAGDAVFFAALKGFYGQWKYRSASFDDLVQDFGGALGPGYGALITRYCTQAALPSVKKQLTPGKLKLTMPGLNGRFSTRLKIQWPDGRVIERDCIINGPAITIPQIEKAQLSWANPCMLLAKP